MKENHKRETIFCFILWSHQYPRLYCQSRNIIWGCHGMV